MKNKQGFTLVELLVVIAIIGILSTVAVMNLNSVREEAKVAAALGWAGSIKPLVVQCDTEDGTMTDPMTGVVYTGGGNEICSIAGIGLWPLTLPEEYSGVFFTNNTADANQGWQYVIFDFTLPTLPPIWCDDGSGCDLTS